MYMKTPFTYKEMGLDANTGKTVVKQEYKGYCYLEEVIEDAQHSETESNNGKTLLITTSNLLPRPETGSKLEVNEIEYTVKKVFPVFNPDAGVTNHFEITLTGGNY